MAGVRGSLCINQVVYLYGNMSVYQEACQWQAMHLDLELYDSTNMLRSQSKIINPVLFSGPSQNKCALHISCVQVSSLAFSFFLPFYLLNPTGPYVCKDKIKHGTRGQLSTL
ncbi:hypothetical protein YC2023_096206 [Brassica napus]